MLNTILTFIFSRVNATLEAAMSVCRSVGRSVGLSVRSNKNEPNRYAKAVSALEVVSNVTAPAQKHATDAAVYTALLKPNYALCT